MLDVLFINHSAQKAIYQDLANDFAAIEPPTWSLLLAQSCRAKGFNVAILDCDAEHLSYDEAVERIKYLKPRLACFAVYGQNPNSGTTNMEGATNVAKLLKQISDTLILFVGTHTSALPEEVLGYDFVDFIAINEGVYCLHALLSGDFKTGLDKVPSLGYKKDGKQWLNPGTIVPQDRMDIDLPGYAWDLLPYDKKPLDLYRAHFWHAEFDHNKTNPFAALYTSLGCNFSCSFCVINIVNRVDTGLNVHAAHSNKMRFWSPEFIIQEFDKLVGFGVYSIRIADELFLLNKKYYEQLCLLLGQRDYAKETRMWAYSRIDTVNERLLETVRLAGIKWLALGIESANQVIRQEITKGKFKEIDIREIIRLVQNYDVNVIANYIYGFPHDTFETMNQTLNLSIELNTLMMNCYPLMMLPGSPLYMEAKQKGINLSQRFSEWSFLSYDSKPQGTDYLTAAEVLKFRDDAWQKYFSRPEYLGMVENRLGVVAKNNIIEMAKVKLRRRLLENVS